ncbi:MAG: diguanylate cyclase (GGDEF)-like protein/PAS domain S-box-containing protein [Gammaproteobacteria bacterium]
MFGYTQADIHGVSHNIALLMHPDDLETWKGPLREALKGEIDVYESEQRLRHKAGHFLTCLNRGRVLERDATGRAVRIIGTHIDITQSQLTQNELRNSNERLNIALENAHQGIWEWFPETNVYRQYGYSRFANSPRAGGSEITGEQLNELTHPDDREPLDQKLVAYLRGETSNFFCEIRAMNSAGIYRTYLLQGQAMERTPEGRIARILGTQTDISDIKRHSQHLDLALANAGQGLSTWHVATDVVEFSDSWYALFGYDPGEITSIGTDFSERIHPDDYAAGRNALIGVLKKGGDGYQVEYRFRCKNGDYRWVMDKSRVVESDASGRPTLIVGTYTDITAQKIVEHDLKESRRVLEMVLDTIPDMVYWKDAAGHILGANRQCAINAGFKESSEVVGLVDEQLPWAEYAEMYRADDIEVISTGKPKLGIRQAFANASGEELLIETKKIPVFDETGTAVGVVGISQEITKKRQHEKRLEKIAESITGGGNERLLDALAKGAAEICNVPTVYISKFDYTGETAHVVSTFPPTDPLNGATFPVSESPGAAALPGGSCVFSGEVKSLYPNNKILGQRDIESFLGKALIDSQGNTIGIIALLDSKPLVDADYAMSVLEIIGATAANELLREQREIELKESEERYRTIYDNMPTMICMIDDTHKILDVNDVWTTATGFSSQETLGSKFADYLSPTSAKDFPALHRSGDTPAAVEYPELDVICKDLSTIKVTYKAVRVTSSDGLPVIMTVLEDITERIAAQQQINLAATAFETHEALVIRDADKRILRVNNAFKSITGYTDEELLGRTPGYSGSGNSLDPETAEIWAAVDRTGQWDGERANYRGDGSTFSVWQTITAVTDHNGKITHYVENFTDISELKQALADAERLALFDPLTELPNRRYLAEHLESSISSSRRHGTTGALLFIDLDQFKNINDSLGHAVGDGLLVQVAQRLLSIVRVEDTTARLGGDEFVVILSDLGNKPDKCVDQARRVADKIHTELGKTYLVDGHQLNITPTIGVTMFPEEGKSADAILQEADSAMYQGKADGRNITKFFHPSMQSAAQARLGLERDLRTAIARDELTLFFQPQYDKDRKIFAAEALLRWQHPERGSISPGVFIPIAEESGLILEIGRWVFGQAMECLRRWDRNGTMFLDHLAINVSSRQFSSADFVRDTIRDLVSIGVPPQSVVIEVTEGTVIENFTATALKMEQLRDIGIRFSVDDFGIGYSSLSYLSRLPLDQLKIDRSFVTDVLDDANDAIIAETIIGMGRNLHLQTIAEGVETEAQLDFLAERGCDGFQGFLFSPAVAESEFLALDRTWKRRI